MRSAASGALPRRSRVPPLDRRFNAAEPTYCQLVPPSPPSVIDSRGRTRAGFWRLCHRLDRTARKALVNVQAVEIVYDHRTVKNGGFPIRDAFHRSGALPGPLLIPRRIEARSPASDVPSPVARYRFGLARPVPLPAATESGHAEPTPPTDFCNRQRA
jgi:hypothetical protein